MLCMDDALPRPFAGLDRLALHLCRGTEGRHVVADEPRFPADPDPESEQ